MIEVANYIRARKKDIQKSHPFIQWLGDDSIPMNKRLGNWLPRLAALVMGFRDLNRYTFVYPEAEAIADPQKNWINNYVTNLYKSGLPYESDLAELGLDNVMSFNEILTYLWHEDKNDDRRFFYRICEIAYQNDDPVLRYCLLLSIDDLIENVLFNKTREIVEDHMANGGERYLHYLGKLPPNLYSHEFIKHKLDDVTRTRALSIAEEMMDQIELRWLDFLDVSTKGDEIFV